VNRQAILASCTMRAPVERLAAAGAPVAPYRGESAVRPAGTGRTGEAPVIRVTSPAAVESARSSPLPGDRPWRGRARAPGAPRRLPPAVETDWDDLATPTGDPRPFDPGVLDGLPAPVARWVRHAIAPGTPLRRSVRLTMHGEIRAGRWQPFSAEQVLAPPRGFVWAATASRRPLRVRGFDRYSRATGEMRWRLGGVIPVMSAAGDDITRSAAGRLASELVLVPAAALDPAVSWQAVDGHRATADVRIGEGVHHVTIEVDERGAVRSLWLPRWGNPDGGTFAEQPFGGELGAEATFDGYTIPTTLRAGWGYRTDAWPEGIFFRATIDTASWR
jgi:hypothetical protein